jgi:hypothetical protein
LSPPFLQGTAAFPKVYRESPFTSLFFADAGVEALNFKLDFITLRAWDLNIPLLCDGNCEFREEINALKEMSHCFQALYFYKKAIRNSDSCTN